jgi:hypothetical protein
MKAYFLLFFSLLFLTCEKNNLESLTPFEQNKRKWEALEVDSYTYSFQISCFCVFEFTLPKEVKVVNNVITQVNGVAYDKAANWEVRTIDQLFDIIADAEKKDAHVLEVKYDPKKGYPSSIFIDYEEMTADEEVGYTLANIRY